jgi:tRNA(Ile)-lysidine synthase
MDLLQQFVQHIEQEQLFQAKERVLIAVSGGVDSSVLCELCHKAGFTFTLAHCNFHLRGDESDGDEAFVRQLAMRYGAELLVTNFDTIAIAAQQKKSVETTARELRYAWFEELLQHHTPKLHGLLTAHHADDNIETVVMHFFRGTGIAGLHGILPKHGKIIRPLLFARRDEIVKFAEEQGLAFVTDSTNQHNDYTRNYFRNVLLPGIQQAYPGADKNILHNIKRFTEAEMLYEQALERHKKKLLVIKENEVHLPMLLLQKTKPLYTILYEILKPYSFTAHQIQDAIQLLQSETGKYILSATHRLLKNRNWLIIAPLVHNYHQDVVITGDINEVAFAAGKIIITHKKIAETTMSANPDVALLDAADISFPLLLRKWKTGDYFYPLGMTKKKKLSRFFIDNKIPLHQKENIWIIESNKRTIWVVGLRIDNRFSLKPTTKQVLQIALER